MHINLCLTGHKIMDPPLEKSGIYSLNSIVKKKLNLTQLRVWQEKKNKKKKTKA